MAGMWKRTELRLRYTFRRMVRLPRQLQAGFPPTVVGRKSSGRPRVNSEFPTIGALGGATLMLRSPASAVGEWTGAIPVKENEDGSNVEGQGGAYVNPKEDHCIYLLYLRQAGEVPGPPVFSHQGENDLRMCFLWRHLGRSVPCMPAHGSQGQVRLQTVRPRDAFPGRRVPAEGHPIALSFVAEARGLPLWTSPLSIGTTIPYLSGTGETRFS